MRRPAENSQTLFDLRQKTVTTKRFVQPAEGSGGLSACDRFRVAVGGSKDATYPGRLVYLARRIYTIALSNQADIHQNDIGTLGLSDRDGIFGRTGDPDDHETSVTQIAFNGHCNQEFVFDDQDTRGSGARY